MASGNSSTPQSKYYKEALEEYNELLQDTDPEEWDQRIQTTGCYVENMALQLCHADTGDWRQCLGELQLFKRCWEDKGNNKRTHTVNK